MHLAAQRVWLAISRLRRAIRSDATGAGTALLLAIAMGLSSAGTAAADPLTLGPFSVTDIFETPTCAPTCQPADFPEDWGALRTFSYTLKGDDQVTDVLIDGTWGGVNQWSAPVQVYLEGILVAQCTASDPCITDVTGRVGWNSGAGFLLSTLGVDFNSPATRALFEDGSATLSIIQTDATDVDLSNLELTVYVERNCEAELCNGIDDDCDLVVDNDVADIFTGTDVGECQPEIQTCTAGAFEITQTQIVPAADDQCDGLDNDCDGDRRTTTFGLAAACMTASGRAASAWLELRTCDTRDALLDRALRKPWTRALDG